MLAVGGQVALRGRSGVLGRPGRGIDRALISNPRAGPARVVAMTGGIYYNDDGWLV